ncbi:MAG: hypothetical protein V3T17_05955 [Pseudomonadales bacterium]
MVNKHPSVAYCDARAAYQEVTDMLSDNGVPIKSVTLNAKIKALYLTDLHNPLG